MKYEKGSFITVPNREQLSRLKVGAQCLFMWLCAYADEHGCCFPSRSRLAKDLHCSVRSVDAYIETLVTEGFLVKEQRIKNNEKQSNHYQIMLVSSGAEFAPPSAESARLPGAKSAHRTQSTSLTQSTEDAAAPATAFFSWEAYLRAMDEHKAMHIQLLAFFFRVKKIRASNIKEARALVKRHLRAARMVIDFDKEKVLAAIDECMRMENRDRIKVTMETVFKVLTK
jgi:hypothetical protein